MNLSQSHLTELTKGSLISDEIIEMRGYRSVTDAKELIDLGFKAYQARHGLLLPIWSVTGSNGRYQLKPLKPRKKQSGKTVKYETMTDKGLVVDVPPICRPVLGDPSIDLWITEGIKKSDSLASQGLCAIGLLGVYGWRGKNGSGGKTLLPDFEHIAWNDRKVFLCFDSDVTLKPPVLQALKRLKGVLSSLGAHVEVVFILAGENEKIGVDDYFASGHTADDLYQLAEKTKSLWPVIEESNSGDAKEEEPTPTTDDYLEQLDELGYTFRLNKLGDILECNGKPVNDLLVSHIKNQIRDIGLDPRVIPDIIQGAAYTNQYHPIREYLDSLTWDGQDHIANLMAYFTDSHARADNSCPIFSLWFKLWIIGAIAKIYEQGQNAMLVLDGSQNIGKSHFVRWLCPLPDFFIEGAIDTGSKDSYVRLMKYWIWEVSELGSTTRKSDREALKDFITKKHVTERKPYDRYDTTRPAAASLIGTLNNESGFLTDPTGNRRFLTVSLTAIDWNYTQVDVTQVWAQAVALYRNGERWQPTDDERELRDAINNEYEVENPVENILVDRFNFIDDDPRSHFVPSVLILDVVQSAGIRGNSNVIQRDISATLKKLGRDKGYSGSSRVRGYFGLQLIDKGEDDI